jgi:hypothetical protein
MALLWKGCYSDGPIRKSKSHSQDLMTDTDAFSKMLCLKNLKIMYNVQNNSHVYCNTPLSEAFRLLTKLLYINTIAN